MKCLRHTLFLFLLVGVFHVGGSAVGHAQEPGIARSLADYRLSNHDWNGMSFFDAIARGSGWSWRHQDGASADSAGDFEGIQPEGGILCIIYPEAAIEPNAVLNWVEQGGSLLIADDFGEARSILNDIGITRHEVKPQAGARFRANNPAFQYLEPGGDHSLTEGVATVLTNHPTAFAHDRKGLFPFSDDRFFLYDLSLGKGRILAASDPSVFINAMIPAGDNRTLIRNITSELCRSTICPAVFVAGQDAATFEPASMLRNSPNEESRSPDWTAEVRVFVESFSDLQLGETGRRILTIALGLILMLMLFFGFPMLQQRSSMKRNGRGRARTRRERLERQLAQLRARDSSSAVPLRLVDALEEVFLDDLRAQANVAGNDRSDLVSEVRATTNEQGRRLLDPILKSFERIRAEHDAGGSSGPRSVQTVSAKRFEELCDRLHQWAQFTRVSGVGDESGD